MSDVAAELAYVEPRLLVAADAHRLAPILRSCCAPVPVIAVADYLEAVAELPRAPTQGVLLGVDPECRRAEAAIAAIKTVAGEARVVMCCEPAYEPMTRRLVAAGLDDYVIFPPTPEDLQKSLHIPSRNTRQRWLEPIRAAVPTHEELARLGRLLQLTAAGDAGILREMACVVAAALRASSAMVVVDGSTGAVGPDHRTLVEQAVLTQDIVLDGRPVGQIRVGPSMHDAYNEEDTGKLRVYAGLFASLLDAAANGRRWRRLALQDDLTGLPNRRRLMAFLDDVLVRADRERFPVTVLMFDIDDFKSFNDSFGHEAGDDIIRETGLLFRQCCRKQDLVARYGGDEFVVVFWDSEGPRAEGPQQPAQVIDVLNRFRKAMSTHRFERLGARSTGSLTCSGGLAHFPWQGRTSHELLQQADEALLEAKRAGKNRFWLIGSGDVCPANPTP
jgi:diguanylate cyclase (GGDEF)-like protein